MFYSEISVSCRAETSLEQDIQESKLIIWGKLAEKYTKRERLKSYGVVRDRNTGKVEIIDHGFRDKIMTTFVFSIKEVVYGTYSGKTIEVKQDGGCFETECISSSIDYNFSENEEGVLFLKHMYGTELFMSVAGSYTVFTVNDNELINKSHASLNTHNSNAINNEDKLNLKHSLSMIELKQKIDDLR